MSLPRRLKNFLLHNEGLAYLGEVEEVVLPKLTIKSEDYRAGNMPGPVKMDMGLEPLTLEWTAGGYLVDAIKQFGVADVDGVLLRMTQALQADDNPLVTPSEIVMRGRHFEVDMGTAKAGEKTTHKYKTELSYYKLSMGGEALVEIDMVNGIYTVGDVDRFAAIRVALGL